MSTVTVQGDSLSVGTEKYLRDRLNIVSYSAMGGRHVDEGIRLLREQKLGDVVVFALGTNDYWEQPITYFHQLQMVCTIIGERRLIVPTIWAYGPVRGMNNIIRNSGPMRIEPVRWADAVAKGKVHLRDNVHPQFLSGYEFRAKMIAKVVNGA